jgi:hypothetical protein
MYDSKNRGTTQTSLHEHRHKPPLRNRFASAKARTQANLQTVCVCGAEGAGVYAA